MDKGKKDETIHFQRHSREPFEYKRSSKRILPGSEEPKKSSVKNKKATRKQQENPKPVKKKSTSTATKKKRRRRTASSAKPLSAGQKKTIFKCAAFFLFLLFAVTGVKKMNMIHKERVAAKEAARIAEIKRKAEASKKRNEWVEKDGKSYYYGPDGEIMTGRLVQENKIYYTNDAGAVIRTIDGSKPMVSLTFDDGPSAYTDKIVQVLEEHESAGTFFEVGERLSSYKKEEQAVVDSYSELANHTYNHKILTKVGAQEVEQQISKCTSALKEEGEVNEILFRPPGGAVNDSVKKYANSPILLWSIDTLDWKIRDADSVYQKATTSVQDGDVILMHSLYESTYMAVKRIVPELKEQGFQLVTMSDLIALRSGAENGMVYTDFRSKQSEQQ